VPYRLLKEPFTHVPGKVKLEVFVDFYCPHCHHFETTVLPELMREFGTRLEVTQIGFPIIQNKPRTPFELYEAARAEGKGAAMAKVLFRALQDEGLDIRDPTVEGKILKEVGLDPTAIKRRLSSGQPKRALDEGIARADRHGVRFTPTVLLDGHVLAEVTTAENLKPLIRKLLAGETF
jgi:thiol:disulfide interchange protein DsbA